MNLAALLGSLFRGNNNDTNNFGALGIGSPRSMFGGMANNPSINSLSNANAMSNYANNVGGFQNFGRGGGLFGTSGMGMVGNMLLNTLARKQAAKQRQPINELYNTQRVPGLTNADFEAQGGPGVLGNFDPISQMGSMAVGAGSALAKKALGSEPNVDPCSEEFDYDVANDYGHSAEDIRKYRENNCKK
tara:strand:+ start:78 stop:644 length:567 start_codon:yes stop_codon:yes gene_type:complete